MIPEHYNCQTNEEVCDYLVTIDCPTTCPYALSLGIGAVVNPGDLEKEVEDDETREM